MKILLSAFACSPYRGSEEGVGWGTAHNLAQHHRVHVLTTPRWRETIEQYLAAHPCANLSFSYHDIPPFWLKTIRYSSLWQIYYYVWQQRIAHWAGPVVEEFDPDVIHHITYGRYWTPSSLWKLGRPFIWGPLGGGDVCPRPFLSCLSTRGRLSEWLRSVAQTIARCDPALKETARHTALALAGTAETEKCLAELGCPQTLLCLPNALDSKMIDGEGVASARTAAIFCAIGRLLDWKGYSLAIEAFARAGIPDSQLVIIGEGPARQELERRAAKFNVTDSVKFVGNLPRPEVLGWLRQSVALVHPSLHDHAPTVAFEAMAVGTPVIALALGGITMQVSSDCGFLVPAVVQTETIDQLSDAMRTMAHDPERRSAMGEAGRRRMLQNFTWTHKTAQFESLYQAVLGPKRELAA